MLSMDDCIAFSGLTPDQLDAVACYKHIPLIIAAEWAETTLDRCAGYGEVLHVLRREAALARAHHLASADLWRDAAQEFQRDHLDQLG